MPDSDGDFLLDHEDPCPFDPYHDPIGDACNHDEDGDGFQDEQDQCPFVPGPDRGCPRQNGSIESLDIDEVGSALALPVITGGYPGNAIKGTGGDRVTPLPGSAVTLATVTNARGDAVRLRLDVLSGDPPRSGTGERTGNADSWQSTSFDCFVTGYETVTFLFMPGDPGSGSTLYAECSAPGSGAPAPLARNLTTANGILFVAVAEAETGLVVSQDVLFGDAVVIDLAGGQAWSAGAIAFQAGFASNDGDKVYRFDGLEYASFPSGLGVNFLAPTPQDVAAELILFTLDGTAGMQPVPRVRLGGLAYNDDEVPFDFQYEFECFDIVALEDIDPNFTGSLPGFPGLGSFAGHLQLRPHPIGRAGFDAHDAIYGDGNSIRTTPVAGWLVQSVTNELLPEGALIPAPGASPAVPVSGPSAWARPLVASRSAARPFLGDEPATLDAQP